MYKASCGYSFKSFIIPFDAFLMTVLGLNDTSNLVGHFVLSPRGREKRDSRGDEREG